jgi:hypothetical protein
MDQLSNYLYYYCNLPSATTHHCQTSNDKECRLTSSTTHDIVLSSPEFWSGVVIAASNFTIKELFLRALYCTRAPVH